MGVYINIEMPTSCGYCPLRHEARDGDECYLGASLREYQKRPDDCPLVPVPPHGRLIDADALHKLFEDQWHYLQVLDWNENPTAEARQSGINWCINTMHDDAPTIIPAELGEEET